MSILQTIGLSEKEEQVYSLLLRHGEKPAGFLAREAKMKRSTAYRILYDLESKGLIGQRTIGKKIHFRLNHPNALLTFSQQQLKDQQQAQQNLSAMLPDFISSYVLAIEKPSVTTFEGITGLKEIYLDTLRDREPIYALLNTGVVQPELYTWLTSWYAKKRASYGIFAQVIVSTGAWSEEYVRKNKEELRETLAVPQHAFPFQHEVDIYGTKVAIINYKKDEPLIGIIINNKAIAKTMKAWFDLAWLGAKHI